MPASDGRELVISLERMNRIRDIDPVNFTMTVDAGRILETVKQAAAEHDHLHALEMKLFAVLDSFDGSISTEHGIGRTKQATYMSRLSPMELEHARGIKTLFDPDGLMNAGRILPCR